MQGRQTQALTLCEGWVHCWRWSAHGPVHEWHTRGTTSLHPHPPPLPSPLLGPVVSALQPSPPHPLLGSAFEGVKHGDVDLVAPKLIFIAINMLGLAMGLYKLGECAQIHTHTFLRRVGGTWVCPW